MDSTEPDRRPRFSPLAKAIALAATSATLASSQAAAVELALDERFGWETDIHTCGVRVEGSGNLFAAFGLGVEGGVDPQWIDGNEWIEFDFDEPQSGVYYQVASVDDFDGDGVFGRAIVEAYDANGASMGIQMVQQSGIKDLEALFGPGAMSRVVVTALADGFRLGTVGYAETGPVTIDLVDGGTVDFANVTSPTVCDVRVVGSHPIYYSDADAGIDLGLGVANGLGATLLDGSEWMRLEFPYPVDELVLESLLYGIDADFFYGEAVLFAYDESGASLGSTSLQRHSFFEGPHTQTVDVVAKLGVTGIAEVEIFSLGDARRLDRVTYAPEPGMSVGLGSALLGLIGFARRGREARVRVG